MSAELAAALIGLILALTALIKQISDNIKIKNQRAETAERRDRDSQDLHDQVLKNTIELKQLKDSQALTATVVDELRDVCAGLNINIVKLDGNVANLTEAIKELKNK